MARGAAPPPTAAATVELRRLPQEGLQPQVARGADGLLHLVYFRGPAAAGHLLYVSSPDDGRTFSAPVRVNSRPGSAVASGTIRGAQIAIGHDRRVHVAWNGSDSALPRSLAHPKTGRPGAPMLYARSNPRRTAFEPQVGWQAYDAAGKPVGEPGPHAPVPTWSFAAPAPRTDGGFTVFY
jgi:hypothetical protein